MGGARGRRFRIGQEDFAVTSYSIREIDGADQLTSAEREVANMVALGMANKDIATARGTSENTVANQLKSIYRKLQVESRVELMATVRRVARPPAR